MLEKSVAQAEGFLACVERGDGVNLSHVRNLLKKSRKALSWRQKPDDAAPEVSVVRSAPSNEASAVARLAQALDAV